MLPKLAAALRHQFAERLGRDEDYLFVGPRGAVANVDTVRSWWKEAVEAVVVPVAPHLAGMTPHVMRHAGMTYWFAQGRDHKRIQKWGGWTSLVQMLDIYCGVLESLEELNLAGLEAFDDRWDLGTVEPMEISAESPEGAAILDIFTGRSIAGVFAQ